ncbi:MAG: WecB/TagA/CpsF family glycosyltransferase, partial [Candidatus Saccharimonadales bacterium]
GVFSSQLEKQLLADLKRLRPDIVLVGIGFPRQEKLISRLVKQLDHGVLIGEGGTFDYDVFGGKRKKAPRWMQRSGIEWLWRLILEPSRINRQLAIPIFIWQIYRDNNSK